MGSLSSESSVPESSKRGVWSWIRDAASVVAASACHVLRFLDRRSPLGSPTLGAGSQELSDRACLVSERGLLQK